MQPRAIARLVAGHLPQRVKRTIKRVLVVWRPIRRFELALPQVPQAASHRRRSLAFETPSDLYVPRLLERDGLTGYEPETMSAFLAAIVYRRSAVAFDIGANVGVYALVGAATTDALVVGFEPAPQLAEAFAALVKRNDVRCVAEPIALGKETGSATLYLSAATDTSNSLSEGFREASAEVVVPVERLDDYVARTGFVPGVIKIDTESTEPDVLRGASRLLEEHRPWIVCEVLAGLTESELMEILDPFGYRYYLLGPTGASGPNTVIVGDPTYENRDWLLAPELVGPEFEQLLQEWLVAIAATAR